MKTMLLTLITMLIVADAGCESCQAGEKAKIYELDKDGLTLQGKVESNDPKVQWIVGDKSGQLPTKSFLVKLSAGKKYRISMDSKDIDSVLVVQNEGGNQVAWDDDSGGGLNSLLTLDVLKNGTYKICAASLNGSGMFTLRMQDGGEVKLYEVGDTLKINDKLCKSAAVTYNIKLVAGKTYVIDMISPNQKALDPFLRLLDAKGKQLAMDDDGGEGFNARIMFQAVTAGTYPIVATCIGKGSGPFILTVREETKEIAFKSAQIARATKLNDEAVALYRAGKHQQAEPLLRQALDITKEVLGEKPPSLRMCLADNLLLTHYVQPS